MNKYNKCHILHNILVRAECMHCPWQQTETKVATIGPSGVRALPLADGINEGGHYFRYFGPSGVGALPLAAGINEGGHYFRYLFASSSLGCSYHRCSKTPEGVVVGFQIFAWAPR